MENRLERGISNDRFSGELPAYQHVAGGVFIVKKITSQTGREREREKQLDKEAGRER